MSTTSQQSQLSTPTTYHYNHNNTTSQQYLYPSSYIPTATSMNKVVIFDWDDTLYPTADFYRKLHGNEFNGKTITLLSQKVLSIIKKSCLLYGTSNVFIVTNGSQKWNCITAISAKHLYSSRFPDQPMIWKYCTFDYIIKYTQSDTLTSIGDSDDEYIASHNVKKYNISQIKFLHRLKLTSKPKISCMNKQFDLILPMLDILTTFEKYDVNIDYQKKQEVPPKKVTK